jgi:STE24 endopeptidase
MELNITATIILVFLFLEILINGYADVLNLSMLSRSLPGEFRGVYDDVQYEKSQQYLKANTRFGWVSSGAGLAAILVFWFGKGFYFLDQWVRGLDLAGVIPGLIYLVVLIALQGLVSLPFRLYGTFVIEEKFGFNKTTWGIF